MIATNYRVGQEWLKSKGYASGAYGRIAIGETAAQFRIETDAGRRAAMVRADMEPYRDDDEVVVCITNEDIWPSGQWWHILTQFRASYGITDPLAATPFHIIPRAEFDAAVSLAVFSVLMLADCEVASSTGKSLIFYSHDEWGHKSSNASPQPTSV